MTRQRASGRLAAVVGLVLAGLLVPGAAGAQDRAVAFLHGLQSSPETWEGAAARLGAALRLTPSLPHMSSRAPYEQQAAEAQQQLHYLPAETVAVGHSNGGVVAREWSKSRSLAGIVTLGTPNSGAPLVENLLHYAAFNSHLMSSIVGVYNGFAAGCCDYTFLLSAYHVYWSLTHDFSYYSLRDVATMLGIAAGAPVAPQMTPSSPYLAALNSPSNLARESQSVPLRVGLVSIAHNFYWGGPLRAAFPDHGDWLALVRDIANVTMVSSASYLYAVAPGWDFWAHETANRLMYSSSHLIFQDEFWCQAVSWPGFGQCWQNDTIVPVWSQVYPGGLSLVVSFDGPAHVQETRMSDDILQAVLTHYAAIPRRESDPPGPDADLVAYEHIHFQVATLSVTGDVPFVGWDWNDRLSSVHVPPGRTVVLYEHAEYGGESLTLTGDAADLRDYPGPGMDGTWNDAVSSIVVQ